MKVGKLEMLLLFHELVTWASSGWLELAMQLDANLPVATVVVPLFDSSDILLQFNSAASTLYFRLDW